jgi:hypothetical protein
MSEIIAKLGLDETKFEKGLNSAEGKFVRWTRSIKAKSADMLPSGAGSVDVALRAAQRAVETVRTKLRLARQPEEHQPAADSVAIALRAQERAKAAVVDNVLPTLPAVERRAGGIIGLLRRKFSSADLFKDTIRGLGIGLGAGGIASTITDVFSSAAEKAKALAASTADILASTLSNIANAGGPVRELELQRTALKGITAEMGLQQKLIADLRANPLTFLTPSGRQMLLDAESTLFGMQAKQADIAAQIDIATRNENRRTEALKRHGTTAELQFNADLRHQEETERLGRAKRALEEEYIILKKQGATPATLQENLNQQRALHHQRELIFRNQREKREDLKRTAALDDQLTKAELRNASDVEKKQIRLNALRETEGVIKKRFGANSTQLVENQNEQRRLQNEIRVDQRNASRALTNTLANVGADIATGKNNGPRPRGRSERERIADRARANIVRAEEAVRTGQNPDFVASLTRSAAIDLQKVGGKIDQSTSKISKADANATGSSLLATNSLLKEIRDNLKPVKTNAGGGK